MGTEDDTLAATGTDADGADSRSIPIERGDTIGRYVVLSKLGAGAMGAVFAAYDPELDRKVALKLLYAATQKAGSAERLRREAQALARLGHPNVVSVFDVGEHDGRTFLAMEHVAGKTLGQWMAEGLHPWREVVEVFIAAGRGLAAAHAKHLVHRDFKPDNVLVGDDGRIRVTDFGLARASTDAGRKTPSTDELRSGQSDYLSTALTQVGAIVGTPKYMAPEQYLGEEADARSDQFAFCVALFEALFDEMPFAADTLPRLVAAVTKGRRRTPERERTVPAWVRAVVYRGLEAPARQRWPDMDALLAALRDDPSHRRRRWLVAGVGAATVAAGIIGWRFDVERRRRACDEEGRSIEEIWNAQRRDAIADAFEATGVSHAAESSRKMIDLVQTHVETWKDARTHVCLAARIDDAFDETTLAAAIDCLDERRLELEAFVDVASKPDAELVHDAIDAAGALPDPTPCRERGYLASRTPLFSDERTRKRARALVADFARISTLRRTARLDDANELATRALEEAQSLDIAALHARALFAMYGVLAARDEHEAATQRGREAFFIAIEAGAEGLSVSIASSLAYYVGSTLAQPQEGELWAAWAEALLERQASPRPLARAELLSVRTWLAIGNADIQAAAEHAAAALELARDTLGERHPAFAGYVEDMGRVQLEAGKYGEARHLYERALELRREALGADHPSLVSTLRNLAATRGEQGDPAGERETIRRAYDLAERAYGPRHRLTGAVAVNLSNALLQAGDYERAAQWSKKAISIHEDTLGPMHPSTAGAVNSLASIRYLQRDLDTALELFERVLAIWESHKGDAHPDVAKVLTNIAIIRRDRGELDAALAAARRGLAIREKTYGAVHPDVANSLHVIGTTLRQMERPAEALPVFERHLEVQRATLGPDHPHVAMGLFDLGETLIDLGRVHDGRVRLEEAMDQVAGAEIPPEIAARLHIGLANALWIEGVDRQRAVELAQAGLAVVEDAGMADAPLAEEIRAWLARHRRPS